MPFHQRTVEPARLHRPEAARAGAAGAPLFRSLEQVSAHALVCLLEQLADLSRCAGDIFGELEGQAAALGRRTAALHRRLDDLHAAAARLDHRRVKIREWRAGRGRGARRGGAPGAAPSRPLAAQGRLQGCRAEPREGGLLGGDGLSRDRAAVQVAGTCGTLRLWSSGMFLAALMEWARGWALGWQPCPSVRASLRVGDSEEDPGGQDPGPRVSGR